MNVGVETVPNQDRRPLVVIIGAEGTAVRRRGVLEVVGLAAFAVEPAVAVGQRRVGGTGLVWICIPRPGVLCDHRDPPLPLNGMAFDSKGGRPSEVAIGHAGGPLAGGGAGMTDRVRDLGRRREAA
jgi:hypothetical protein